MKAEIILKYFPSLTEKQQTQFERMDAVYREWNEKINVISRRDIDNLYPHHVLHSLGIARAVQFPAGATVLDIGTGGGFPGIPLAVLYPECRFRLIDSIGKKIRVAQAVIDALGLTNVTAEHRNAKEEKARYNYVVSRAVMQAPELFRLVRKNIDRTPLPDAPAPGLICLKGGDIDEELAPFGDKARVWSLKDYFAEEEFFETKKVVYITL